MRPASQCLCATVEIATESRRHRASRREGGFQTLYPHAEGKNVSRLHEDITPSGPPLCVSVPLWPGFVFIRAFHDDFMGAIPCNSPALINPNKRERQRKVVGVVSVAGWIVLPNRDSPRLRRFPPFSRAFRVVPVQGGFHTLLKIPSREGKEGLGLQGWVLPLCNTHPDTPPVEENHFHPSWCCLGACRAPLNLPN